jgi:hypothetical protein
MNRDIQALIIDLTKYTPSKPVSPEDVHTYHSYQRARLHALISQEQAESAERLEKQVVDLVSIAAEQKHLAAKLDVQTDRIITLTRRLNSLTIWLIILTFLLVFLDGFHFIEVCKNPLQIAPYVQQTNRPAQQDALEHAKP